MRLLYSPEAVCGFGMYYWYHYLIRMYVDIQDYGVSANNSSATHTVRYVRIPDPPLVCFFIACTHLVVEEEDEHLPERTSNYHETIHFLPGTIYRDPSPP